MTSDMLIMFAGTAVALVPFLGLPLKWDNIILVILGVIVIALGIAVRRRAAHRASKGNGSFVESVPRTGENA